MKSKLCIDVSDIHHNTVRCDYSSLCQMPKLHSEGRSTLESEPLSPVAKTEISCLVGWKIMSGALHPHDTP